MCLLKTEMIQIQNTNQNGTRAGYYKTSSVNMRRFEQGPQRATSHGSGICWWINSHVQSVWNKGHPLYTLSMHISISKPGFYQDFNTKAKTQEHIKELQRRDWLKLMWQRNHIFEHFKNVKWPSIIFNMEFLILYILLQSGHLDSFQKAK